MNGSFVPSSSSCDPKITALAHGNTTTTTLTLAFTHLSPLNDGDFPNILLQVSSLWSSEVAVVAKIVADDIGLGAPSIAAALLQ